MCDNFPTISLEQLARQQGGEPVTNLDEFGALWPAEFDPDEFLAWLSTERNARRRLARPTEGRST